MAAAVPLQYRRFSRVCQRLAARIIIYFYDNWAKQYDKSVRKGALRQKRAEAARLLIFGVIDAKEMRERWSLLRKELPFIVSKMK